MSLGKFLSAVVVCSGLSGCTVLGFAADVALNSLIGEPLCEDRNNRRPEGRAADDCDFDLVFTQAGAAADAEKVAEVIETAKAKKVAEAEVSDLPVKPELVVCQDVKQGQQQCVPAEHYQDIYR